MYPRWFAPVPERWQRRGVVTAGFPMYRASRQSHLQTELKQFLVAKGSVAVIYPGSAAIHSVDLIRLGIEACRRAGLPFVVVARELSDGLKAEIAKGGDGKHVVWTSFDALLKHARVLIYHGGIGTCAQALAAGLPQLILASAYDQFENGARIQGLGVGKYWKLTAAKVSDLHRALESQALLAMVQACPRDSELIQDTSAAVKTACDLLAQTSEISEQVESRRKQ